MSDCVIISGTLYAKLRNKFFASFHQRYVELVYVENNEHLCPNKDTASGHYEMRLFKTNDKSKSESAVHSFTLNPISMTCYVNYVNSNKHQFTFVCSSQQNSICFSAHTKYERDAWLSVLEQLQWQYQPSNDTHSISQSNTTISRTNSTENIQNFNINTGMEDDICADFAKQLPDSGTGIDYVISLTTNEPLTQNYFYNYYSSHLVTNNKTKLSHNNCSCDACHGQKFTILGLLTDL